MNMQIIYVYSSSHITSNKHIQSYISICSIFQYAQVIIYARNVYSTRWIRAIVFSYNNTRCFISFRFSVASGNRMNPQKRRRGIIIMEATTESCDPSPDFSIDNGISWMTDGSVTDRFAERSSVNSLAPLHSTVTTEFADARFLRVRVYYAKRREAFARAR